jgi:hypothetical protein
MPQKTIFVGVSLLLIVLAVPAFAANTITIKSTFGDVAFPHKDHQERQESCQPCHTMFAKAPGAIEKAIAAGTLKTNAVMEMCMDCHEAEKAKGKATGPLECRECHNT